MFDAGGGYMDGVGTIAKFNQMGKWNLYVFLVIAHHRALLFDIN